MITAILRAQLLSMRLRAGTRRGSAIFGAVTGLVFYGFWAFIAWATMLYFSQPDGNSLFVFAITGGLMLVMLYWQLAPVISASFGASLDLKKLLAYPIPHGKLFLVEVMLRIVTCGEMLLLVAGVTIGLLRNPAFGARSAPRILAGALIFVAMNILLSAGTRNWIERVFLRTKFREVMVAVMVLVGIVPRFLIGMNPNANRNVARYLQLIPSQVAWPWSGAGRLMLGDSPLVSAISSAGWLAIAFLFSRWQFERNIRYDAAASGTRRAVSKEADSAESWSDRAFRLPSRFLPDPFAALAEKELRTLARIPRFRLVYVMSCVFGLILYLPNMRRAHPDSFFIQNAVVFMSLYGLLMLGQITYWNCLGFDRGAAQGYFSWPVRLRDVLISKNITVLLMLVPQILLVSLAASAMRIPVSPGKIGETIAVVFITALYWLGMGNICSVRIPRALDPDKMNQMSNKMQSLTILAAPILLAPLGLAYAARWYFESDLIFGGLILVAGIVGAIFYWVALDSAVNAANVKRESLVLELARSDSPLSIT